MNRGTGGYTIIEVAVVIVAVSILAGVALVGGDRFLNRTRDERQRAKSSYPVAESFTSTNAFFS